MAKPAFTSSVEAGTSTLLPYVDEDLSLIYLGGKVSFKTFCNAVFIA